MMSEATFEGGCDCKAVRYRLSSKPLFVNCCHCRWCQRESGSAFALNAMIEAERVQLRNGADDIEEINTPSESGKGQLIIRCKHCKIALWSHYAGAGRAMSFVRVGTLDKPDSCPPDVHIFTESKQRWVVFPEGAKVMKEYYKASELWPKESLERRAVLLAKLGK